jgi:hypothetical protein
VNDRHMRTAANGTWGEDHAAHRSLHESARKLLREVLALELHLQVATHALDALRESLWHGQRRVLLQPRVYAAVPSTTGSVLIAT